MKSAPVNDVGSMSLTTLLTNIPNYYFVSILNSDYIFDYYREFINCTVNIQINDIRQVPIVIPVRQELEKLEPLFKKVVELKRGRIGTDEHESSLSYLKTSEEAYLELASMNNHQIIKCVNGDKLRDILDIHEEIYNIVNDKLG